MFFNTVFRFWWLLAIFTWDESNIIDSLGLLSLSGMVVEAIRRTFWAMIRVENEFYNNFEQYRDILMIPPIKDETIPSGGDSNK